MLAGRRTSCASNCGNDVVPGHLFVKAPHNCHYECVKTFTARDTECELCGNIIGEGRGETYAICGHVGFRHIPLCPDLDEESVGRSNAQDTNGQNSSYECGASEEIVKESLAADKASQESVRGKRKFSDK